MGELIKNNNMLTHGHASLWKAIPASFLPGCFVITPEAKTLYYSIPSDKNKPVGGPATTIEFCSLPENIKTEVISFIKQGPLQLRGKYEKSSI